MNVGEGAADNRIRWMGMEERGTAVKWAIAGVMALMAGGFLGAPAEGSRDEPAEPQVKRAETAKADEPAGKNEEAKGAARKDRLEAVRRCASWPGSGGHFAPSQNRSSSKRCRLPTS